MWQSGYISGDAKLQLKLRFLRILAYVSSGGDNVGNNTEIYDCHSWNSLCNHPNHTAIQDLTETEKDQKRKCRLTKEEDATAALHLSILANPFS